MPHTNRKKKSPTTTTGAGSPPKKHIVVHTKRTQLLDAEGWTHVIDSPSSSSRKSKPWKTLNGGDFEVNGFQYINRTLPELQDEVAYWRRSWAKEGEAELERRLIGVGNVERLVVLGLGSLQSARREGRRAGCVQLAAVKTLSSILGAKEIFFQDPAFTALDIEILSEIGQVLQDPEAFERIDGQAAVFAVHCYADVYRKIGERRPRVFVGTEVGRWGMVGRHEETARVLEGCVEGFAGCEFPQCRTDFSDTWCYWRKEEGDKADEVKPEAVEAEVVKAEEAKTSEAKAEEGKSEEPKPEGEKLEAAKPEPEKAAEDKS